MSLKSKFIGDRAFYKMVAAVAIPMMIQNGITNFVNMLDNIMVGSTGTLAMSGVAIVNLLMFVFNLTVWGALSGAGLYGAQFYGAGNMDGVRQTLRFKILITAFISTAGILIFHFFDVNLISAFLRGKGDVGNPEETLAFARSYLKIMLVGLFPAAVSMTYASTLRETGETVLPMKAGIAAVLVNLAGNWLLIFGHLGFPRLGVQGAAIATVISRFAECLYIVLWTHSHQKKNPWAKSLFSRFTIQGKLVGGIIRRGWPLLINEFLWSAGLTTLNQCYSVRGLSVVAACNISDTIGNLFNIFFLSMGSSVGVIVGQILGAGDFKKAHETDTKLIATSVGLCVFVGILMAGVAPFFPLLYRTEDSVRKIATSLILIRALCLPIGAFMNASYFTLRAGGSTLITFIFDSVSIWIVAIPIAYCLSRFTTMPIEPLYLIVSVSDLVKCVIGFVMVKKGTWLRNIVDQSK